MLGTVQHVQVFKSTNGGASDFAQSQTGITEAASQTLAPFSSRLYHGASSRPETVYTFVNKKAYKSTDFGDNWTALDLTATIGDRVIRNFAASAASSNAITVVTSGPSGWATPDGGTTWQQFGDFPSPGSSAGLMSYVWFDTNSPCALLTSSCVLYAASVNLSATANHLWRSTDWGVTWTAIDRDSMGQSNGFPFGIPVHVIQNDPANSDLLLAGTDFGVYRSTDGGASWSAFRDGMPLLRVNDLFIAKDLVRAASYGRGVWELERTPSDPVIITFNPPGGPVGTSVVITGRNFSGTTEVRFNGVAATPTDVTATSITVNVPEAATTGSILIGTESSASPFTVTAEGLSVTGFDPGGGSLGRNIRILGTSFLTGVTSVQFNGTTAPFVVDTNSQITATVPPGATTGPISVTSAILGTATSSASFSVVGVPTVSGFDPPSGAVGSPVTITGTNFWGVTAVRFGGTEAVHTVVSDTEISATVPTGATTGRVSVVAWGGTATSPANFTVVIPGAPTITGFSINPVLVGTSILINGTNFTGATAVTFNGTAAPDATVLSGTQIQVTVPAGATAGPVRVTTPVATAASATFYPVQGVPTVTAVHPNSGVPGGHFLVNGTNYLPPANMQFIQVPLGTLSAILIRSLTQIEFTVSPMATVGSKTITMRTLNGSGVIIGQVPFTINVIPATSVTGFDPQSGPVETTVTIFGTNLSGTWDVLFNGVPAAFMVGGAGTFITATVSASATTGPITVFAPGTPVQGITTPESFTVK